MLSHPRSSLQDRHRRHRRQISTPTLLEAGKVPNLPTPALQRFQTHRRGQSLDQRSPCAKQFQAARNGVDSATRIATNGTVYHHPQMFQELQQQHQQQVPDSQLPVLQHSTRMALIAESQAFSQEDLQALAHRSDKNACMSPHIVQVGSNFSEVQSLKLALDRIQQQQFSCGNVVDRQSLDNGSWSYYQQNNLAALQQQASDISKVQQPRTPALQTNDRKIFDKCNSPKLGQWLMNSDYRPITPATTPFRLSVDLSQCSEAIKSQPVKDQYLSIPGQTHPLYMQRAKSLEGVTGTTFTQQSIEIPSPPNTASFDIDTFDIFDYQQASSVDNSEPHSQNSASSSSTAPTFPSMSEPSNTQSAEESNKAQKLPILPISSRRGSSQKTSNTPSGTMSPTKPKLSPRVASIGSLNLDSRVQASIKETGITIDEIASFIHGPDPEDGKWVCLHTGCGRRFGRKENIKSHVQTHLGDRQYKCDHCNKCFVRGHDLKRHAKIHTGDKPYECLCGNVFARHDALTRHRQRGMCIGGYKGIVRKTTKRGRPRKHRPEMGERQNKAAKTHEKVAAKSSSVSGSDTSRNSPPSDTFKDMHIRGSSPPQQTAPVFQMPDYSLPPAGLDITPPASPGYNTGSELSSDWSYRSLSPTTEDEKVSQPLSDKILAGSGLPFGTGVHPNNDTTNSDALLSPRNAPTLTDSSTVSDLDIFISQDPTTLTKDGLQYFNDPDMVEFPNYSATSTFGEGIDLFPGKGISTSLSLNDDDFFSLQFHADEQPSDVFTRDFSWID
ncbi:Metallothionein expression activator [Monascus purpureus]|uniref:Metallothionein expression activator n=1 Tax=Monascus purpureus TaxID=5098 RepID=A0A507QNP9_MONPU|nr:Metallothionein expression activator [Monascus purpureus]BDD56983.1 hypothetical protein MAP00_002395 [Monascus purpureus]